MYTGKLRCSFCDRNQDDVKKLVAGHGVYICNGCVDLSYEIVHEDEESALDSKDSKLNFYVIISLHTAFNDVAPANINLVVEKIEGLVCQKFLELARQNTQQGAPQIIAEPVPDTNNPCIKTTSVNFAIDPKDLDTIFPLSQRLVLASKDFADAVHALIVRAYVKQEEDVTKEAVDRLNNELRVYTEQRRAEISIFQALLPVS